MSVTKSDVGLTDLLDLKELQSIQDSLADLSGLSIVIFDPDGDQITQQSPPDVRFCEQVMRSTPDSHPCRDSDAEAMKRALRIVQKGEVPKPYRCHAGLWDFVAPILIDGSLFGYLWCGRVRAEEDGELDPEIHRERALEYGINPDEYMAALREVPVVPKKRIEDTADVVYPVAMAMAIQVYQRMTHQRRADKAAADLLQRTQELTILNRTAALVLGSGDPRKVLRQVLEEAQKAINADCLCLYRYNEEYDRFDDPITIGLLEEEQMRGPATKQSRVWQALAEIYPSFADDAQDAFPSSTFVKREQIASSAAFPLRVQRRRVGVLFINFRTKQEFSSARRQALTALANQVALAIAYHRAVEESLAKADQLSLLNKLAMAVLEGESLDTVFEGIVKSVSVAFGFDGVALYLVEEEKNRIRGRYAQGLAAKWLEESVRPLDGKDILPNIWQNGRTELIVGDDPRFDEETYKRHQHKDWVRAFIPVRFPDRVVGVLEAGYLLNTKPRIEDEEVKVLESFVHQVEIAIRNARWLAESHALLKIAQILAQERDTGELLEAIVSEIREVVPCGNCSVILLDKETGFLKTVISQGLEAEQVMNFPLEPGEGITWHVFESGESEIVNSVLSDSRAFHVPGTRDEEECLLLVPIRSGDRVLGTINLNRYGMASFTEHDRQWVTTVANQVGVALERNELLQRYQRLAGSARTIAQTLPLDKVLNEIVKHAAGTLDAPVVNVMLLMADGELPMVASVGLPPGFELPIPLRLGVGLSGLVADQRIPYQTPDMEKNPNTANQDYLKQHGHISYLGVPMIHRDQIVGVLNVHTKHERVFSPDEIEVFTAFADLAAVAVSNARAFDQAVREFELLAGAGAAVSSPLGLDAVLNHLLREGCELVGASRGSVRTVDETRALIIPRSWWPLPLTGSEPPPLRKGKGISGHVWNIGKPYRSPDVSGDPYYEKFYDDVVSEMAVPILAQNQVIGILNVSAPGKDAFQQSHERLLVELANLSSIAIEKSNLLAALREVAEATVSEPTEFLRLLIAKVSGLVRVVCAPSIWLLDEPNKCVHYAAGEKDDPFAACAPLLLDVSISGEVLNTAKPMAVEDIFAEPLYFYKDIAREAGIASLLSVPIMAGDKAIGVFNVHTSQTHKFQDWEIDILSAFAAQAGAAIEINRNLSRLRLLQNYAARLSSARDLAQVVNCVVEHTRDAVDADVTCLWLYDSVAGSFHYGGSIGLTKEDIKQALPRPDGMSAEVLQTGAATIVDNTKDFEVKEPGKINPDAIKFGIEALGAFPMFVGERPIGVLHVDFLHSYYYTSDEIETLEAMARLAAGTIDNARSVEATQQFLTTITHDLKAPLSAVDAQLQRLGRSARDPERVRKIHGEIRRMTRLIENLLGLLRAEYAEKPLKPEQVDLVEMLSNIEDMWSALVQKRGLGVEVAVSPGVETVSSDRERVRCIVFNLLDNAVKFARKRVFIGVEGSSDQASFAIAVEDDGTGMSADEVERFRLASGQSPGPYWEEMRSGVGYAAVRRFTADMGGQVDIQSSRSGTKVVVWLPFLKPK